MRLKFETFWKGAWVFLALVFLTSLWVSAQTNGTSETAAADGTNAVTVSVSETNGVRTIISLPDIDPTKNDFLMFGLNKVEMLQTEYFGNPLAQYLAFLIYVILASFVSKLFDWVLGVWLKKWASKTRSELDDMLVDLLRGPVKIVSFVILLHIGLKLFSWPGWVENFISKGFFVILACSVTYVLLKLVDLAVAKWVRKLGGEDDKSFQDQIIPIVRGALKTFVVVIVVLVTSQNLGLEITGILASLSVVGLALGLAAQDTVANLFGAATVFLDKPFKVGDRVVLENVDGFVELIGIRSTRVRNLDGHLITVPNKTMGNATITNISRRPNIKTTMNIGVTYDTTPDKVREALAILKDVYKDERTSDAWISFNTFADSSLNIVVIHWFKSTDYKEYLAAMQDYNLAIKTRFEAAGIEFAFPSRTLYVKQDSDWKVGGNPGVAITDAPKS